MSAQIKYTNLFLALLLISTTLLGGCAPAGTGSQKPERIEIEQDPTGGEQNPTEAPETPTGKLFPQVIEFNTEAILQDNVNKLEQETVEAIREYNPESGEIIIPADAPFVNEIQEGQIIVYGISDKTPTGLLRRVVSVQPETVYVSETADASGRVVRPLALDVIKILTTLARLQDLFEKGQILVNDKELTFGLLESTVGLREESGAIVVSVNETLSDSKGGEVSLNGDVFIKPKFDFDIRFNNYVMQYVELRNETKITSKVNLTVKKSFQARKEVPIYTLTFKPQTIMVEEIPIVYRPVINVFVGTDGSVTAKINFSVEHQATFERAYKYSQGEWSKDWPDPNWGLIQFSEPEPSIDFQTRSYVRPELEIIFYEIVGLFAKAEFYLELVANPSIDPWWELYGGVDVILGFEFKILGDKLPNYEHAIINKDWKLDWAKEPAKVPEPTETPPPEPTELPPLEPTKPPPPQPTPPPPAGTGNENIRIVYNNTSAFVMSITQGSVWVKGLVFNRIDNQGNVTASYQSQTWENIYSGYDPIQPGYCPRIALPNSPTPSECVVSVNRETQQEQYHFWRETSTSKQFQVWQNGILLQTCQISAGSCDVYVPQS